MTRFQSEDAPAAADFERLFVDEPAPADPGADLLRGRRRRRRRRVVLGAVAAVAAVAVGGTVSSTLGNGTDGQSLAARPSPAPTATSSASRNGSTPRPAPTPAPGTPVRDTAPALRRDKAGNYLDADGHRLGGSIIGRDPDVHPFHATTRNSWELARRHLDRSGEHLDDYEAFAFTGGAGGGGGLQVGQKLGWSVRGERGEGMVQLAVTRAEPGEKLRLGSGRDDSEGFCNDLYLSGETCRRTTVAGIDVYTATTSDGGFVMDRRQDDGEVASILVSPVFANNTDVALRTMRITPAAAAALLDDPALDVIG